MKFLIPLELKIEFLYNSFNITAISISVSKL